MRSQICGVIPTGTLFQNDELLISDADKQRLVPNC